MSTWRYYNKALIPTCSPHEQPDLEELKDKKIWNQNGNKALFARWTTDWDCGYETDWWYVIKDEPFDISKLKAKRRYEINKGIKNFEVRVINPKEYKEELYNVQIEAFSAYPKKYRPPVDYELFKNEIDKWKDFIIFGAFKEDMLCGYALLKENESFVDFSVLKTIPRFEKEGLNAGLVYNVLMYYNAKLNKEFYICDGSRAIFHETAFQNYLEKYFEFRKAYGKLKIDYKKTIKMLITVIYPFRKIIKHCSINIFVRINAVLRMEEIKRKCEGNK